MSKVISVSQLHKKYGQTQAVDGLDLEIEQGEIFALLGPNGAGKSSVLRAAAGLVAYSGSVAIDQKEIPATSAKWRAQNIAYVPQMPLMPDDMTVYEYVLLGRNPHIKHFSSESAHDKQVIEKVLTRLDLTEFKKRMVGTLSGGERQRIVIARALAQEAPVLLLDEPTSALDPISTGKVEELVHELKKDYTIAIVTHNMQQAARCSDFTAYMYLGELIEFGSTEQIFFKPKRTETEDYITGRFG